MLVKLIRSFVSSGWNGAKLISSQNCHTSSVLFQQPFSGTNSGASSKPQDKAPNLKNQQQKSGNKNKGGAGSDNEQERSQQQGPADKQAEQKASNTNEKLNKSKK